MALVQTIVRLEPSVADRIDALAGKGRRAAWIRDAIEAALDGKAPVKPMGVAPFIVADDPPGSEILTPYSRKFLMPAKPDPALDGQAEKRERAIRDARVAPRRNPPGHFHPIVEKVRDLLKTGNRSPRSIQVETGLSYPAVERALRELGGEVHYPQPGIVALL